MSNQYAKEKMLRIMIWHIFGGSETLSEIMLPLQVHHSD